MKLGIIGVNPIAEMVIENIKNKNKHIVFFDDDKNKLNKVFFGYRVIGPTSLVINEYNHGRIDQIVVCYGDKHFQKKKEIIKKLTQRKIVFPQFINRSALLSPNAIIGSGTIIGKGAIIGNKTIIQGHSIIWSGVVIEHDCKIERYSYLGPNATLSGFVHLGECSLIGSGAVILPEIKIGKFCIVGAGAVVTKNILDYTKVAGVPAKKIT